MKKQVLKVMLGAVIIEVVLVCLFILTNSFNYVSFKALGSGGIIFGYSIPCLFYSRISDDERYKNISIIGSVCAFLAALLAILFTWGDITDSVFLWKTYISLTILVGAFAIISLELSFPSVNELFDNFKKACIVFTSIIAIWYIGIIITEHGPDPDGFFFRLLLVLNVLEVGSIVCTLILSLIYKKEMYTSDSNKDEQSISNTNILQQIDFNTNTLPNNVMSENNQVSSNAMPNQNLNVPLNNVVNHSISSEQNENRNNIN